jgi:hypothetical protein
MSDPSGLYTFYLKPRPRPGLQVNNSTRVGAKGGGGLCTRRAYGPRGGRSVGLSLEH